MDEQRPDPPARFGTFLDLADSSLCNVRDHSVPAYSRASFYFCFTRAFRTTCILWFPTAVHHRSMCPVWEIRSSQLSYYAYLLPWFHGTEWCPQLLAACFFRKAVLGWHANETKQLCNPQPHAFCGYNVLFLSTLCYLHSPISSTYPSSSVAGLHCPCIPSSPCLITTLSNRPYDCVPSLHNGMVSCTASHNLRAVAICAVQYCR